MSEASPRRRAVFLDRDGTLNVEVEAVLAPGDLKLIDGAGKAVRRINEAGLLAILVTNQAIVARGDCDVPGLDRIHDELRRALAADGARLDAIYFCPHHPGYTGACDCRKPAPGLILAAQRDFNIDLPNSWVIGDSMKDIRIARNVGARAALVKTGKAGRDAGPDDRPDAVFESLGDAVTFIAGEAGRKASQ
ncbi:MAG: HAD-IIIA family hydrolase [Acidobacteriota bacterium]|nr:HAD-IIIA family hydrolase [Acidobacteriota bacterium]